ncbi:hypothetical protein F5888DRAFT_1803073 [Russula emetica]|nr:hypothetical protein F5888DRAFT_1803073 [Russula emetica]
MSPLPPIPPNIARITAPLLLGVLLNWCLFGVLVVQTYVYSYNFPEDGRRLKLLGMRNSHPLLSLSTPNSCYVVYAVFLLETVQTALTGADVYYWFASGYGDMNRLTTPFANAIDIPIVESIVSAMVQFFYTYRVWILSNKSWWFCSFICLFSTLNAASALTGGIHAQIQTRFATGDRSLQHIAITWLSATVVSDILIASAMVYYLINRRRETDSVFHNNALVKIVRLTVETNALTTSVGIVSLLVFIIFPDRNWSHYLTIWLWVSAYEERPFSENCEIIPSLSPAHLRMFIDKPARYSNTLLVSFNNRISIRNAVAGTPAASRSTAIAFAVTPRSDGSTDISCLEGGRSSAAHKLQLSGDV